MQRAVGGLAGLGVGVVAGRQVRGGLAGLAELRLVDVRPVGQPAALDVGAVGPAAIALLLAPAVVEHPLAGVQRLVGLIEAHALAAHLLAVPVDALVPDDVLEPGPDAVLAVAPLLVHVHDRLEAGHQLVRREDAQRLAVRGKRRLALLLALAAADVDLVADDSRVAAGALDDRGDAHLVGADLGAVVGGDDAGVRVAVDRRERDLELAVEQLLAVVVLDFRVLDVVGVHGEDLDVRGRGQAEVVAVLVRELECVGTFERPELRERAAHHVADVVAAAVEGVEAGLGDVAHQRHHLRLAQPVVLDVLPGGQPQRVAAVGVVGAVVVGDAVQNGPLPGVEGAAAGDGHADHVHPVLLHAGFRPVVLEVEAVALGEELGFLVDVQRLVVPVALRQGADHAGGLDLEVLVGGELVRRGGNQRLGFFGTGHNRRRLRRGGACGNHAVRGTRAGERGERVRG